MNSTACEVLLLEGFRYCLSPSIYSIQPVLKLEYKLS